MHFKVSSSALNSRLTAASKVLATKNTMPILDCFLIDVSQDGQMTITASDSEKCFIANLPVLEHDGSGRFCVLAKTLLDSTREIPEQPISIYFNEMTYELLGRHNSGQFTLMAQSAEPYPEPRPVTDGKVLEMPAETLLSGINNSLFATANEEVRMVMNGIYFDIKPDHLIFASTDGKKLVKNIVHTVQAGYESNFILPKKVAAIIKSIITKDEGNIRIMYTFDRATITTEDLTLHFRLIEGNYPNYNAVIPAANPNKVLIDRVEFVNGIKRVAVCSNPSTNLIRMDIANNKVNLTAQDIDFSVSANETISCSYDGQPVTIGFKSTFLVEILSNIDTPTVVVELADSTRAGVFKPVSEDNTSAQTLMLLMPMMINA